MLRVRFAPSPTGFLHVGSARTFIFNWLYARHNGGTMILRLDDTDVERNTQASVDSIFDGLKWLNLSWDEEYKQSERLDLHRKTAWSIFEKGLAYRDFTPAHTGDAEKSGAQGTWLFNPGARELTSAESDRRAAAGEPFALRFRVPREAGQVVRFSDAVYGEQVKAAADIEDFALNRSDGMPTYHLASCADDADLRISHIIRGQDHLSNTYKHVLIFEAAGCTPPQFAHLPLLVAPDGTKLSKRRHGPVVSVTTYRDAGFLSEAFINFLCLLGWSPKNDRENMSLQELTDVFSLEGINRSNAVVNFKGPATTPEETFDQKAVWLNAEHIRGLPVQDLSGHLLPVVQGAACNVAIAVGAIALSRNPRTESPAESMEPPAGLRANATSGGSIVALLFLTGLTSMGMEVVWVREFTPYLGTVVYAFAGILGVYLTATFIGSRVYRRWSSRLGDSMRESPVLWTLLGVAALLPLLLSSPDIQISKTLRGLRVAIGIAPFTGLLGFLTPMLVDRRSGGDPGKAGSAYAVSVLGCILGPLLAGFLLLPYLSERWSLIVLSLPWLIFGLRALRPSSGSTRSEER